MRSFVLWFVAVFAVLLAVTVMGWALYEMVRKTEQRKEYFAALVGLLGTMVGAMVGGAVQELRVEDKEGQAQEARTVAVEAADAAHQLQANLDTVMAVVQRTQPGQAISTSDHRTLSRLTSRPPLIVPVPPQTWRRIDPRSLRLRP